jgi:phospholipid/cholesterol/gamma-HCH transport system permease protein
VQPLVSLGQSLRAFFEATGRIVAFAGESTVVTLRSGQGITGVITQTRILALRCAVPVMLVAGPIGAMLAMQSLTLTRAFGVDRLLPPLVAATIIRELGPGFAAVMVCFQAGAGISAELGTMRVQEELDALNVMGVDARSLVVGPRVIGTSIATALLNALAIATGLFGAWVVAVPMGGMGHAGFVDTLFEGLGVADVWLSELKAVCFGFGIGAISVTFGYFASGGPAGVGRAANRTVVACVILVLVSNYLINTALLGAGGG